ncbi:MAG: hypothetical protein KAJ18_09550 [Candidatus Omnitrophica bacterium]|nr:hypothetical protein [Candidatus Omnitrophota bacterium]
MSKQKYQANLFYRTGVEVNGDIERNLGGQPVAKIMAEHHLKAHDVVAASREQITHKMVARAVKGRRLTPHVKVKILGAVNEATGMKYAMNDLFNY